jgi:hypothetical protein
MGRAALTLDAAAASAMKLALQAHGRPSKAAVDAFII